MGLLFVQHDQPPIHNPTWPDVLAGLQAIDPRTRGYFSLSHHEHSYVQAAGARLRMICECRTPRPGGDFRHVVLGHPDRPTNPTSINTASGIIQLRRNEILTLNDVIDIFESYYLRRAVPSPFTSRDVTHTFGPSPGK